MKGYSGGLLSLYLQPELELFYSKVISQLPQQNTINGAVMVRIIIGS